MSAVLEQINGLSVSEKVRIMEYLLKSIAQTVQEANARGTSHDNDFSRFADRWPVDGANVLGDATSQECGHLLGAASVYAKPSLRRLERMAFRRAMEAKHATIR